VFGLDLDSYSSCYVAAGGQPIEQALGQRPGSEANHLGLPGRRVEIDLDGNLLFGGHSPERLSVDPARQIVKAKHRRTESGGDLGPRQSGEAADVVDPEPCEQVSEILVPEDGDGERGKESPGLTRRHDGVRSRGDGGREPAVRDPDPGCGGANGQHRLGG
jgi:hypothetical protein